MRIIETFLKNNRCFIKNQKMKVNGLMLHSVGCSVEKEKNFLLSWNNEKMDVCVHAFIEENADVYQTLPWDTKAWHAGRGNNGSANDGYIGIELCEPKNIIYSSKGIINIKDMDYAREFCRNTYITAVLLFAVLCVKYDIKPLEKNKIISHSEGYKLGIASNHGDVEHLWNLFDMKMDDFRRDVNNYINENKDKIKKYLEENDADYIKAYNQNKYSIENLSKARKVKVNGNIYHFESIIYKENYYIKLREFEKIGANINYDDINKIPEINF